MRPSARSSAGHDRVVVWSRSVLVSGSEALVWIGRSMRRAVRRARARYVVRDLLNATAPGAGHVGGDMLRRRRSRPASGFIQVSQKQAHGKLKKGRQTLAWFFSMLEGHNT